MELLLCHVLQVTRLSHIVVNTTKEQGMSYALQESKAHIPP